uniref:Uncharacterized protein n=1 Tax=Arion vulgaris TaxID=1028688 RepID=A0A0B7B0K4_9EUPU
MAVKVEACGRFLPSIVEEKMKTNKMATEANRLYIVISKKREIRNYLHASRFYFEKATYGWPSHQLEKEMRKTGLLASED